VLCSLWLFLKKSIIHLQKNQRLFFINRITYPVIGCPMAAH